MDIHPIDVHIKQSNFKILVIDQSLCMYSRLSSVMLVYGYGGLGVGGEVIYSCGAEQRDCRRWSMW